MQGVSDGTGGNQYSGNNSDYSSGYKTGALINIFTGYLEAGTGGGLGGLGTGMMGGGIVVCGTGVGCLAGGPAAVVGAGAAVAGAVLAVDGTAGVQKGMANLSNAMQQGGQGNGDQKNNGGKGSLTSNFSNKIEKQFAKRGWSQDLVNETVNNPYTTREALNKANGNPATAFYNKEGQYVVRDNKTGNIVQISDKSRPFSPDPTIKNPYSLHN